MVGILGMKQRMTMLLVLSHIQHQLSIQNQIIDHYEIIMHIIEYEEYILVQILIILIIVVIELSSVVVLIMLLMLVEFSRCIWIMILILMMVLLASVVLSKFCLILDDFYLGEN
jgi:hypothetical protein